MIDSLESRRLLASVSIVAGKLRIEGTSGNDVIAVARFGAGQAQVIDNGNVAFTFDLAAVRSISFAGLGGDDLITIGRVPLKAYLNGGDGNDSLSASAFDRADTLIGGDGADYLYGGPGNDLLDGGADGDLILAGDGDDRIILLSEALTDDTVSGGLGTDTVDASAYPNGVVLEVGNPDADPVTVSDDILGDVEVIIGSAFNDDISVFSGRSVRVEGGAGNDTITTGRGNDTLIGGPGNDLLSSAGGNDVFDAFDTQVDTLNGGSGDDIATADPFDVLNSVEST